MVCRVVIQDSSASIVDQSSSHHLISSNFAPPAELYLFSTPPAIRLPHIRRRLDRRDELQHAICETDDGSDDAKGSAPPCSVEEDGSDEDVDWRLIRMC